MPHDKHGNELKVGDKVTIECEVKNVDPHEDYCNLTVETVEPMHPGEDKTGITLNAKQVIRACLLLLGLLVPAGVTLSQEPEPPVQLCRLGKCDDCDCGPRIKDCGCFRVAGSEYVAATVSKGKGPPVTIDDRNPKVLKPVASKPAAKPVTPGVVVQPAPFTPSIVSGTTGSVPFPVPATTARYVVGQPYRTGTGGIPSSGPVHYGAPTYTLTGSTGGFTSGNCANGQCGTVSRGWGFFGWR